ncbi:MAG: DUF3488 domain-containing protein [Deltaproteobacteria bacterium]|nr:DUF3488 domain-containing protein [Deltaproteobacteria bacterium]
MTDASTNNASAETERSGLGVQVRAGKNGRGMRFDFADRIAIFAMALAGLASVLSSGRLSGPPAMLLIGATIVAWFVPERVMVRRSWILGWTLVTVAILFLCTVNAAVTGSLIQSAVWFILSLTTIKLYNRAKAVDRFHLYITTLMSVVGAASLNMGPSYLVFLILHTIAAVWVLILYELRREMETSHLVLHAGPSSSHRIDPERVFRSKRIVGPVFFAATSLAALAVFLFTGLTFVIFPRMGLAGHAMASGGLQAGFGGDVALNQHGLIRDNPTVVMRVTFQPNLPPEVLDRILWRGVTYDRYEAGRWNRSRSMAPTAMIDEHTLCKPHRRDQVVRQSILLSGATGTILVAAHRVLAIEPSRSGTPWFLQTKPGQVFLTSNLAAARRYRAWSLIRLAADPDRSLPADPCFEDSWTSIPLLADRRAYLALPDDLGPRFYALVGRLTRRAFQNHRAALSSGGSLRGSAEDRIRAAMAYLAPKHGFRYTRRLVKTPKGADPVVHFLLKTKAGHCEYFASGLALLLRAMRIPTRLVTGFVGGRWNPYGHYLAVREGDAHAWVEAWLPHKGWVALDPTPPAGRHPVVHRGAWYRLQLWLDTFRRAYLRWILDYDVGSQIAILQRLWRTPRQWRTAVVLSFGGLIVIVLLVKLMGRSRQDPNRKRTPRAPSPAIRVYHRMLRALERRAGPRRAGTTPLEYVNGLPTWLHSVAQAAQRATETYYELRYAPSGSDGSGGQRRSLSRIDEERGDAERRLTGQVEEVLAGLRRLKPTKS